MGDTDPFAVKIACPKCGDPEARMTLSAVKCPNKTCANFDAGLAAPAPPPSPQNPPSEGEAPAKAPKAKQWVKRSGAPESNKPKSQAPQEQFDPVANRLEVRYRNFRKEEKTFIGDSTTLRSSGGHISLRVAPTGRRISLAKESILNWAEVHAAVPSPPPTEASKRRLGCGCLLAPLIFSVILYFVYSQANQRASRKVSQSLAVLDRSGAADSNVEVPGDIENQGRYLRERPHLLNSDQFLGTLRKYYPQSERLAGREATVVLVLHVGIDGNVNYSEVKTSGGAHFDAAAGRVARFMRFSPGIARNGRPVAVRMRQTMNFRLKD